MRRAARTVRRIAPLRHGTLKPQLALLPSDDPKAVVLNLDQPLRADGRLRCRCGKAWRDKPAGRERDDILPLDFTGRPWWDWIAYAAKGSRQFWHHCRSGLETT